MHRVLRRALPGITLVQVVHVEDEESVRYALSAARTVDALLLDSGRLKAPVKELGGTGRTHDWALSRQIRDHAGKPIFLAGGLTDANVTEAIRTVEPFGLDLTLDGKKEIFTGPHADVANPMLTREYRKPFVVPAEKDV